MVTTVMGEKVVNIHAKDGEVISFSLVENVVVIFDSDNIVIEMSDRQILFPLSDYVTFSFEEISTRINSDKTNTNIICKVEGNMVKLKNLPINSIVCLYSLSGFLLDSNKADKNGTLQFDLNYKKNQVILVQTANKCFKILF